MNKGLVLILLLISWPLAAKKGSARTLHELNYTVDLRQAEKGEMSMNLRYLTQDKDSTVFYLPDVWGASKRLEFFHLRRGKGYHDFKINHDSTEITFHHRKGILLDIYYVIQNGASESVPLDHEVYFPKINAHYFSCYSVGMFMAVKDDQNSFSKAKYRFVLPEKWEQKVVGSLGNGSVFKTGIIQNSDVQDYIFMAGDIRTYQLKTKTKQKFTFAIHGDWSFKDEEIIQEVVHTLDQQRKFWNDYSTKRFFVSLSPLQSPNDLSMSYTGTGLTNSFAVSSYHHKNIKANTFQYLFHHELMHHWIGKKLRNAEDEELSYWFSEGFTDYFARLNMLNCGAITEKEYWNTIDSVLAIHYGDKRSTFHNDSIKEHFWDDRFISKIPYNRGSIFAMYLDYTLRKATHGEMDLQTIMQAMLKHANFRDKPFLKENFVALIQQMTNISIQDDLKSFVIQGNRIPIEKLAQVLPSPIQEEETKVFDLGFSFDEIEGKGYIVTAIQPKCGISTTDLKVGETVYGFDYFQDPKKEAKILVERNGEKVWVTFFPYESVKVPQVNFN